jgi:hypothetical protein
LAFSTFPLEFANRPHILTDIGASLPLVRLNQIRNSAAEMLITKIGNWVAKYCQMMRQRSILSRAAALN